MIKNVLAGVATKDLSTSIAFYQKLLERKPDGQPMPELAEWKLPGGGCLQVFQDQAERAGRSSVTLVVENLEAELQRLGNPEAKKSHNSYVDTAILRDPDGNQVVLAQPKSEALAQ